MQWAHGHWDCCKSATQLKVCLRGAFVLSLCPGRGLQSALCGTTHRSRTTQFGFFVRSQRTSSCWHLGAVSLQGFFFLFSRLFNILIHHTAQSQPYSVHNVSFFFFFPPSNWELSMKFWEELTPMTLTVLLICWGFSWFLKALNQSYWERCKSLRIELMILQEWGALPSFSHRFLKQRLPYAWSWMTLLLLREGPCFHGLHHVFLNFRRTKPGYFNEPNSIIPNPKVKH